MTAPRYHITYPEYTSSDDDSQVYSHLLDLIAAIGQGPAWHAQAACRGMFNGDPGKPTKNIFFPGAGGDGSAPLSYCERCPVQAPCLEAALQNHEVHGYWGGKSERQRRRLRREQGFYRRPLEPGTGIEAPHGTLSRYRAGCDCKTCGRAYYEYQRQWLQRRRAKREAS